MSDIDIDVYYNGSDGQQHAILFELNCSRMTWKSYDARLDVELSGTHGPPGIGHQYPEIAIVGTAFWLSGDKSQVCFGLRDFISSLWRPNKYPSGSSGTGKFYNPPSPYKLHDAGLEWYVS